MKASLNKFLLLFACLVFNSFGQVVDLDCDLALLQQENQDNSVTKSIWRPIQAQVRDTVVQIFSQIAAFDWLQPYKTPAQGSALGSGFLISDQGEIITNAHVVNQAIAVWIQIPSLGKRLIDVEIISICPDRDIALLKISDIDLNYIKKTLGTVPFLTLGDSDKVYRADEVLALGYPLGQESLKSTSGLVSGHQSNLIQISAAINPGNSGGPLLNREGQVIGINSSGFIEAQNVGYAIPINDLKIILEDLKQTPLLRKPYLGLLAINANEDLVEYLGNPPPGGCYVGEVVGGSPLALAGLQAGDMIYQVNGLNIDINTEMTVPWSEDKISIIDYVSRLTIGQELRIVFYRNGQLNEVTVKFDHTKLPAVRKIYPGYEQIDYEIFGGMVVMELTDNHIKQLAPHATGLTRYAELKNQTEPILIITHIFPNSKLARSRTLSPGIIIREINGVPVNTIEGFRKTLFKSLDTGYFTIKAVDTVQRSSDNLLVVFKLNKIINEIERLANDFHYPLSSAVQDFLKIAAAKELY